jgi:hypothetical protein
MALPSMRLPAWYRGFAIFIGILSMVLAFVVLADPGLGVALLIILLAFALIIIGIDRLVAGITGHPFGLTMNPLGALTPASSPPPGTNPPTKP